MNYRARDVHFNETLMQYSGFDVLVSLNWDYVCVCVWGREGELGRWSLGTDGEPLALTVLVSEAVG